MPLKLTPATGEWKQSASAEQSPVATTQFQDALHMSRELSRCMQSFIAAAAGTHFTDLNTPSAAFIQHWKTAFEKCLNEFGAQYEHNEHGTNAEQSDGDNAVSLQGGVSPPSDG